MPSSMLASQTMLLIRLPIWRRISTMSVLKDVVSRVRERTLEMWVPRERWMPLHSIQRTIPRLMDTHSVFDSDPQSAHHRLPWS